MKTRIVGGGISVLMRCAPIRRRGWNRMVVERATANARTLISVRASRLLCTKLGARYE
jgi:hypothetical protein